MGDPWLAWDAQGILYLSLLANVAIDEGRDWLPKVWAYESGDGGQTWSVPIQVPFSEDKAFDHPLITTMLSADATGLLVMAMGNFSSFVFSRSLQGIQAFSPLPVYLPDSLNNSLGSGIFLSKDHFVFTYFSMTPNPGRNLWAVRSEDGGQTYSRSLILPDFLPFGFPMLAIDQSHGPYHNRVYVTTLLPHQEEGLEVVIAFSDDLGATWSQPQTVHSEEARTFRSRPFIAVNEEGLVGITWIDRRHSANNCDDVYFAASLNGGHTFLPEVRVTQQSACYDTEQNGAAGQRFRSGGGDYSGLAAGTDKAFYVTWSDSRTGIFQNWLSRIDIEQR